MSINTYKSELHEIEQFIDNLNKLIASKVELKPEIIIKHVTDLSANTKSNDVYIASKNFFQKATKSFDEIEIGQFQTNYVRAMDILDATNDNNVYILAGKYNEVSEKYIHPINNALIELSRALQRFIAGY